MKLTNNNTFYGKFSETNQLSSSIQYQSNPQLSLQEQKDSNIIMFLKFYHLNIFVQQHKNQTGYLN
ncbi:unnamed protein product [Paramecium sonneborni]|uniref:Uncharacterized protein n=1 Tax=Paramecium sonneborni TaxID=65129 RepID=A0A8S1L3Z6_9CILI|nr:unnamed protein product [Paramecium sonneborni]